MKKIFSYIILTTIIINSCFNVVQAEETSSYSFENNYKLYEERVKDICTEYKYKKQLINITEKYPKLNSEKDKYPFLDIKNTHKTNMNNIYKCAILNVQKKSISIIQDLIKKNPSIGKRISGKIQNEKDKMERYINSLGCINSKEKNSIQKLSVLKQATYQTCKYVSYLEYLKEYNKNNVNLFTDGKETIAIGEIIVEYNKKITELDDEIEHTYKIFPLVFHAYTEYENNITIHYLLELLKEDYTVLRDKLHDSLNPINQVVYKIANAMKKP